MNIFITGGAGFIGSHLAEFHLKKGDDVYVVDDYSTGTKENLDQISQTGLGKLKFDAGDIVTWDKLNDAVAWSDRIYHMAAVVGMYRVLSDPLKVLSTNINGTERLLKTINDADKKIETIIASTSEVYGGSKPISFQEDSDVTIGNSAKIRWGYAISKLADETLALTYAQMHQLPINVIRLFNTIGPRQRGHYGMVVPRFVEQAVNNEPMTIFGNGSQSRSFCDVRDTVAAIDGIASNRTSKGLIVNVGNDTEISIKKLAKLIKKRAKSSSELKYLSYDDAYGMEFEDMQRRKPVLNKLFELTQFEHQWTLEKTIDDLIEKERAKNN